MHDVLDLCLECKSCKSECPSNVDMAKIKYEFLNLYNAEHGIPLRSRLVANIHTLSALAAGPQAGIANFAMRNPASRWLAEKLTKVDRRRKLPKVVARTFEAQFGKRNPNTTGSRGDIVLFHDTFMNFNHPEVGIAAVELLEAFGFNVILPARVCCGRPMVSAGMLERATRNARHNIQALIPYAKAGTPIVGCESSCVFTLKDEYPDLLPGDPDARSVADATVMLEGVLTQCANDNGQQPEWNSNPRNALLHVHCHERALAGTQDAIKALNLPPNLDASLIDAGCCGMAGSFGFAKEHYDISQAVRRRQTLPGP